MRDSPSPGAKPPTRLAQTEPMVGHFCPACFVLPLATYFSIDPAGTLARTDGATPDSPA